MSNQPSNGEINRSRLVTDQIIKEVTKATLAKQPAKSSNELVIEKANVITQEVFHLFKHMHNISIVPMKYDDAVQYINKMYLDRYSKWDKDEILTLLCLVQAVLGAEAMKDELC